jgi:predicted transcriptional regulator
MRVLIAEGVNANLRDARPGKTTLDQLADRCAVARTGIGGSAIVVSIEREQTPLGVAASLHRTHRRPCQ